MSMRVRAAVSFAGPKGSHAEGEEFTLPDGVDWLEAGFVVPVGAPGGGEEAADEEATEEVVEAATSSILGKEDGIPDGFTGLRMRGAGWHEVIVDGEVVDKIRGEEDAEARLSALTEGP